MLWHTIQLTAKYTILDKAIQETNIPMVNHFLENNCFNACEKKGYTALSKHVVDISLTNLELYACTSKFHGQFALESLGIFMMTVSCFLILQRKFSPLLSVGALLGGGLITQYATAQLAKKYAQLQDKYNNAIFINSLINHASVKPDFVNNSVSNTNTI